MKRPTEAPAAEADELDPSSELDRSSELDPAEPPPPSLDGLAIAGITRRHVAFLLAAFMSLWIVVVFARQVGQASAASARAEAIGFDNAVLEADVAALERELALITREDFVLQQARGHGLGKGREIPFRLAADAPPLPADAPGSSEVRLGPGRQERTPLESWLSILFGPAD